MDSYALINLVLITVIYSTFIAPALAKLGRIRDEIAEISFPKIDEEDKDGNLEQIGDELEKKLTVYNLKYIALKRFLRYFNTIIIIVYVWWVYVSLKTTPEDKVPPGWAIVVGVILLILYLAIKKYMLTPNTVRSVQWLVQDAGLNPDYYRKLINARMLSSLSPKESSEGLIKVDFSILMQRRFVGFRYLLIVESNDKKRCYFVATGPIGKNGTGFTYFYASGKIERSAHLGSLEVHPGKYKAKLLLFDGPYLGVSDFHPSICPHAFEVSNEKLGKSHQTKINMENHASFVSFNGSGYKIKKINCKESTEDEGTLIMLFEQKKFVKLFKKARRPFQIGSTNGVIDKSEIQNVLKFRNTHLKKITRLIKRNSIVILRK